MVVRIVGGLLLWKCTICVYSPFRVLIFAFIFLGANVDTCDFTLYMIVMIVTKSNIIAQIHPTHNFTNGLLFPPHNVMIELAILNTIIVH